MNATQSSNNAQIIFPQSYVNAVSRGNFFGKNTGKKIRVAISYSQFCEHLSKCTEPDKAVMHFTHHPGEQLQVDFAGDKLGYVDRCSGEWIACEVLVCALPYSHSIYAQALRSQKQEDFINGLRHALEYIGGAP